MSTTGAGSKGLIDMLAALKQQFLPEFIKDTRARLHDILALVPPSGSGGAPLATAISSAMRTITGAALLIGVPKLALLARAASNAARLYRETGSEAALGLCARAVRTLASAVDQLD